MWFPPGIEIVLVPAFHHRQRRFTSADSDSPVATGRRAPGRKPIRGRQGKCK
jgi:hypothetical protein